MTSELLSFTFYHFSKVEGKHSSPIWQLKWVDKERVSGEEKGEVLVSIATDGRVVQWSVRKGYEFFGILDANYVCQKSSVERKRCSLDLMHLKRTSKKSRKGHDGAAGRTGKQSEAMIARHASGQTFDFLSSDTNMYVYGGVIV